MSSTDPCVTPFYFISFSFFDFLFVCFFSQGCGALIDLTVNGKTIVSDVTVIGEGCDIEEYLKVGRAAMVVVGDRPTLSQLVGKVGHGGGGGGGDGSGGGSNGGSARRIWLVVTVRVAIAVAITIRVAIAVDEALAVGGGVTVRVVVEVEVAGSDTGSRGGGWWWQ